MTKKKESSVLLENRKAHFLYFLSDLTEAGLVLTGTEIKSLRAHNASLSDSYVRIKDGEAFLCNMHIAPYKEGTIYNVDHLRDRKLLLHKNEIAKFERHLKGTSATIVPTKVYLKRGYAKVEIALAVGKASHDKRDAIKERDDKKRMDKAMKEGAKAKDD
jgi:SsrA-binding protein